MKYIKLFFLLFALALFFSCTEQNMQNSSDPLPSWNEGKTKQSIIDFVNEVTDPNSPGFVEPKNRIATFDNDGTLWSEQPFYFQLAFALDRVKAMAPDHPEWKNTQPFKDVLENNLKGVMESGMKGLMEIIAATHAGMTTDQFEKYVITWIDTAKHPIKHMLYKDMVFQPMLELLAYLRTNEFKTFIVSGGGIEFMRPWAEGVYGIPPEQVVGSSIETKFEMVDGKPVLIRLPKINFIDDKEDKPVGINSHIGKKPIFAFGNSDGDRQMLEWTQSNTGKTFKGLVHHTDAEREWAYGPDSKIGTFSNSLMEEANSNSWTVVDMKNDWKVIYPEK